MKGIVLQLDNPGAVGREEGPVGLAKMSTEQCSKECTTCLKGAGKSRPHRQVPHPDALTLSFGCLWSLSAG